MYIVSKYEIYLCKLRNRKRSNVLGSFTFLIQGEYKYILYFLAMCIIYCVYTAKSCIQKIV